MELTKLKGIGEKTAGALQCLGILSVEDLIYYYPRDYETYEVPCPLCEVQCGKVCTVEGILAKDASINRFHGLAIVNAHLADMTGRLQLSWYNLPYILRNLTAGAHYIYRGRVCEKNGRLFMSQPKMYRPEEYHEKFEGRLLPVYPLSKGLSNSLLLKAVTEGLRTMDGTEEVEYLPEEILGHFDLLPEKEALIRIHFPRSRAELFAAKRRIVFDEFFMFLLAGAFLRERNERSVSPFKIRPDFRMIKFIADLPFSLTKGQQDAYKEIIHDMQSGSVMNRLIEGDVGSGKTIVAVLAMFHTALSGYQAAIMAPTEVLARQHYENITGFLEKGGLPLTAVLLTGSQTPSEKEKTYETIRSHKADIIIGTHALFQEKCEFDNLALVVTDEQHRFGVGQREALSKKGSLPHVLVMSATPIPRTLAIILYGDLDISVIDVLPEGRIPIKNCVVDPGYRMRAYKFIYGEVKKGRQAYIICPAVENEAGEAMDPETGQKAENTSGEMENVTEYTEKIRKIFPPEVRIGMLHGRMKSEEKDGIMTRMKDGLIDVLVSTTVVEVGVDVPNATVMMIENAERCGLSQLHQLRGRVGRGKEQSYCILVNTSGTEKAAERLEIVRSSNDGFHIAEEDLRLRGPGDLFGVRQSGEMVFHLADIYGDREILSLSKQAVSEVLGEDPSLSFDKNNVIRRRLDKYMDKGYTITL